jgi:DNA-binding response OmpR family regulator
MAMEGGAVVLVVDDDLDHLLMLEALLADAGYTVITASSCAEGRLLLKERDVDALVADFSLGDGTASELLRDLGDRRPRVALVLSGFDASEDVERTLDAGFDAHLVKPTSIELLRETLTEGLRKSPSGVRLKAGKEKAKGKATGTKLSYRTGPDGVVFGHWRTSVDHFSSSRSTVDVSALSPESQIAKTSVMLLPWTTGRDPSSAPPHRMSIASTA